jgi:hypothetical protein
MDWTRILAEAGLPEPPGRLEAIEALKAKQEGRAVQADLERDKKKATKKKTAKAGMSLHARKKYL